MSSLFKYFIFLSLINIKAYGQELYPFRNEDTWYYIDSANNRRSNLDYKFIYPFNNNRAIVKLNDDKVGLIDSLENFIIKPEYDTIYFELINIYCIKDSLTYIFNYYGEQQTKERWSCGGAYGRGRCMMFCEKNGKIGVRKNTVIKKDDKICKFEYSTVFEYYEGIAAAKKNGKWGTIDCDLQTITEFQLDSIDIEQEERDSPTDIRKYYLNNKVGFLNSKGEIVTEAIYANKHRNFEDFTLVETLDRRLVYIDFKGKKYYK